MENTHVETLVDWFQITYEEDFRAYAVWGMGLDFGQRIKPLNGYRFGVQLKPVGRCYWGSKNGRMGCNIIFSGEDCAVLRGRERGIEWAIKQARMCGKKVTRIDVACDIKGAHDFTPEYVEEMSIAGKVLTRLKPTGTHGKHGTTETVEWGNRTGKGNFVRVYDKAIELNLDNYKGQWTRVELQSRQSARQIARMLDDGIDIRSIIKRYWNMTGCKMWSELCNLPAAKAVKIQDTEADTEAWLLETMPKPWARVLAQKIESDGWDSAERFSDELYRRMAIELKRILNSGEFDN
jgi:DNA relaxase NicK